VRKTYSPVQRWFGKTWQPGEIEALLLGHFLAIAIVRHRSAPYFEPGERASQTCDKQR
jgi:hypothetical protein